jgi:hypothetical protein
MTQVLVSLTATPGPRVLGMATIPYPRALNVSLVVRPYNESVIIK